ncbi:MAG TPA: hypothetical protein DCY25_10455, partial [Bacteroidales bacterium]|nr:hypothetical protein [Bacteroidales bacterium]
MQMTQKGKHPTGLFQEDKRKAEEMETNEYAETISEEELGKCELSWFRGEIVLIEDMAAFNDTFPRLKGSKVLGFDTETKPSFKKGRKNKVSLIQLANDELACLIRINK